MMDLWPEEIAVNRIKSPVSILREQGSLLGQKTKNIVRGAVSSAPKTKGEIFSYNFLIVCELLGYYRYKLFSIQHDFNLYPVRINVEDEILQEIDPSFCVRNFGSDGKATEIYVEASSEDEFLRILRGVFGSEKVMRVIRGILSQVDPNRIEKYETLSEEIDEF